MPRRRPLPLLPLLLLLAAVAGRARAQAASGEDGSSSSCTRVSDCELCDYERTMTVEACGATNYVHTFLCTTAPGEPTATGTEATQQLVYRPCPVPPELARHQFILFELGMVVSMIGACFVTLRRQRAHQQQHSERIAKRIGLV